MPANRMASGSLLAGVLALLITGPASVGRPTGIDVAPARRDATMVFDDIATIVSEYTVDLKAHTRVVFRTTNLSPGSDPVLHLLDDNGREVAVDNNGGGGFAARLTYTPQTNGNYRIVVRARSNSTAGTCNLTMNGAAWRSNVVFAGWQRHLSQLRSGESLETVKVPNGARGTHLLYVLKSDGLGIELRGYGNGTAGAAAVGLMANLGNRSVVVGVNRWATAGVARLIRNDAAISGHDPDRDGLGSELEEKLGTCSELNGWAIGADAPDFSCAWAADPRDTDGDGISDRWEVLGRRDRQPHQPLPLWGADPRHKDLFVEFDFMQSSPNEAEVEMTRETARLFADYYADRIGTGNPTQPWYSAVILRNPDFQPGIRVHLDIGVAPADPLDATLFGDWGGHNVIPPVQNEQGQWVRPAYQHTWREHLSPARYGIFRHAPVPASGGGQKRSNFSFSAGINEPWLLAHESGHAQGLGHSGPSYITANVDPNCKPNYPSLMNYAYQLRPQQVGFSNGFGRPDLNNAALSEWRAVNPSDSRYLGWLQDIFHYNVDFAAGHVDWNRDGEFSAAGTTVRAYANYTPQGTGCEFTRYNQMDLSQTTQRSPAIARLGNRTYVFWAAGTSVHYSWSISTFDCPVPAKEPCAIFEGGGTLALDASQGLDAIRIGTSSVRLLLVGNGASGELTEARLALSTIFGSTVESWTTPTVITSSASGEPSLARMDQCTAYLAFKGSDGRLRLNQMGCGSSWRWQGESVQVTSTGAEIMIHADASPSIARAYLPHNPGIPGLYGAFAALDGRLDLWWWDEGSRRWEKTAVMESRRPARARPAMAWVPSTPGSDFPGRLYLLYVSDGAGRMRWMMSHVMLTRHPNGAVTRVERVGMDGFFDNSSAIAAGVDLLFEPGIDSNLRAVSAERSTGVVRIRPNADGILDFSYRNYDDWQVLRIGLCRYVVNPGGVVSDPVRCPEKDW